VVNHTEKRRGCYRIGKFRLKWLGFYVQFFFVRVTFSSGPVDHDDNDDDNTRTVLIEAKEDSNVM